jgi:hypothetical protein
MLARLRTDLLIFGLKGGGVNVKSRFSPFLKVLLS